MKHTLKKLFFFIVLLLAGILIHSCSLQDEELNQLQHESSIVHRKKVTELFKDKKFNQSYNKIPRKKIKIVNSLGKTVMEEQYGFTITSSYANEIVTDSLTTYTLAIKSNSSNDGSNVQENLIVIHNNYTNIVDAVIIKYTSSNPITSLVHFTGQKEITPIVYNDTPIETTTSRVYYRCYYVIIPCLEPNTSTHTAGDTSHGCWGPRIETVCTITNSGGGGDDIDTDDTQPSGDNSGSGGINTNTSTDTGTTEPTENHNNTIITLPELSETDPKIEKIHTTIKKYPLIKNFITELKDNLNVMWERCFSIEMENSTGQIAVRRGTSNRGENNARYNFTSFTVGGFHNHPYGDTDGFGESYPMFSPGDLGVLLKINNEHPSTENNPQFMFNGLVVEGNVYVMIPNNPSQLSILADKFIDSKTIRKFNQEIEKIYFQIGRDNQEELAKAFIKFLKERYNIDISIYQMNINNLYNQTNTWQEIKLP